MFSPFRVQQFSPLFPQASLGRNPSLLDTRKDHSHHTESCDIIRFATEHHVKNLVGAQSQAEVKLDHSYALDSHLIIGTIAVLPSLRGEQLLRFVVAQ